MPNTFRRIMTEVSRQLGIAKQHAAAVIATLNAELTILGTSNHEHFINFSGTTINNGANAISPEKFVSMGQTNILLSSKTSGTALIQTSSTQPIRLGKVLPPLHCLDHKKRYRKLDDFVARCSELFVIEGDYFQLQEGAQEIIAATDAAKAAPNQLKKALQSIDSNCVKENALFKGMQLLLLVMQNQDSSGICLGVSGGFFNVKLLSQANDPNESNGSYFE
ncbi:hypothetical protein GOBAR_AA33596 [Gossypium barbadense]|uniref:DUF7725 domain-containing protein n=1 Tax=Gossypium barbadense TaxID=3634 RepID=A0A2P5W7M8_GOSBA|nr:hypothetical protein GOBAR_AA33596 [Gossypium barbadense]